MKSAAGRLAILTSEEYAKEFMPTPKEDPSTLAQSPASPAHQTAAGEPAATQKLTPEEQMALFEKELKEKDWGHQPC